MTTTIARNPVGPPPPADSIPHDTILERQILGLFMIGGDAIRISIQAIIGPDDFYTPQHVQLASVVWSMSQESKPMELADVALELRARGLLDKIGQEPTEAGGREYLASVAEYSWDTSNSQYYARKLKDMADRRGMISAAQAVAQDARDPMIETASLRERLRAGADNSVDDRGSGPVRPSFKTLRQLVERHPALRPPVIEGLLREGETLNIIAQSKSRKSWLVSDLAMAVATGRRWLDIFPTVQGDVLILDNELHPETLAHRLPQIANARGIPFDELADKIIIDNLRGRLMDLTRLPRYFAQTEPGQFKIIVLDSLYRFWPPETSENDNAAIARCYNILDALADRLRCCFVCIHHTSKGSQATKSLVDVGAGAGAISRATDSHLILLAHESDTRTAPVVVLDAASRSFPPIEPCCLRFTWPVWTPAPELDPLALKPDRPRRPRPPKEDTDKAAILAIDETKQFAEKYISQEPATRAAIEDAAVRDGVSVNRVKSLLERAEARGLIHRWKYEYHKAAMFATVKQDVLQDTKT